MSMHQAGSGVHWTDHHLQRPIKLLKQCSTTPASLKVQHCGTKTSFNCVMYTINKYSKSIVIHSLMHVFYFCFWTLQRWQRSCARRPLQVTVGRCTLSATTRPCCLPSPARATSTRKTRRTSRAGSTADPTRPRTATQVQPDAAAAPPTFPIHHSTILQVRRRTSTARARSSADEPAASKEGLSFSFKTNHRPWSPSSVLLTYIALAIN